MHSASTGMVKALQYSVDSSAARVFDGEAVVYDITYLNVAIVQYRTGKQVIGHEGYTPFCSHLKHGNL